MLVCALQTNCHRYLNETLQVYQSSSHRVLDYLSTGELDDRLIVTPARARGFFAGVEEREPFSLGCGWHFMRHTASVRCYSPMENAELYGKCQPLGHGHGYLT
jgi:hypothetical protein